MNYKLGKYLFTGEYWHKDFPAGIAVFLVAIPLCLGIAHASGAPLLSGLIAGVIGGILVGVVSPAQLAVSGPAAGLTAITLSGIAELGSWPAFTLAVAISGVLQIGFGRIRAGALASFVPGTVIQGMLSAIGIILILKQFPHLIGYDLEEMGVEEFRLSVQDINEKYADEFDSESDSFSLFIHAIRHLHPGRLFIGITSIIGLWLWDYWKHKRFKIPGALVIVIWGTICAEVFEYFIPHYVLSADHTVQLPVLQSLESLIVFPSNEIWGNWVLYKVAITLALVASLETLLSIEAMDKIDPLKRVTPVNTELQAQGIGNIISGILGGLPITAVIVRGSVNIEAGGRTKASSITHGIFILIAWIFFSPILNQIPLSALAAILVYTGIKLCKPYQFYNNFKKGLGSFLPFIITVLGIVFTDLLIGIISGIFVASIFIIKENYLAPVLDVHNLGRRYRIVLGEILSFLHKNRIRKVLENIPEDSIVEIDGSRSRFIDRDIIAYFEEFRDKSSARKIELLFSGNIPLSFNKNKQKENMDEIYARLFDNNKKWVAEKLSVDPEYFNRLLEGQTPQYLFIGCSDSRVPANEITGTDPGEMFVHRNIANLVVNTDVNLLSVVQYSIEVLNVKHIIVCGHYGCGGIRAAVEEHPHGLIDKWLRNIKDVYRLHKDELDEIADKELKHRRLVELNVQEQVLNLMKTSFVQKNRKLFGFPQVHGWVYDLKTGQIKDLNLSVNSKLDELYRLY